MIQPKYENTVKLVRRNIFSIIYSLIIPFDEPLLTMVSVSGILRDECESISKEELREFSGFISSATKRLLRYSQRLNFLLDLINKFLYKLDEIESMRKERTPVRFVEGMMNEVLKRNFSEHSQDVRIAVDQHPDLPEIAIKYELLESIIFELVDNTFMRSEKGTTLSVEGKTEGAFYRLTFHDNIIRDGNDIMEYNLDYESFLKLTLLNILNQSKHGDLIVLGFSFIKNILNIYGGSLKVVSKEGEGTIVTLLIPFEPLEMVLPKESYDFFQGNIDGRDYFLDKTFRIKTILVIVNDVSLREFMIKYFLEKEGYTVITAEDGEIGVEKAKYEIPDLIICDIKIPKLTGYEMMIYLHGYKPTAHIPFLFLLERSEHDSVSGENYSPYSYDFLTKPFVSQELIQAVRKIGGRGRMGDVIGRVNLPLPAEANSSIKPKLLKTILVIEDDASHREFMIKYFLEKEGYTVITAENSEIGLEKVKQELPDLIICDQVLAQMGWYDVIQALKKHEPIARIPLIFLTADSNRASLRDAMNKGADDYLTKPFTTIDLIETVRKNLERAGRKYFDSAE